MPRAICKYYSNGFCKHSQSRCKFLHHVKTEPCKYFMSSSGCKYVDIYCKFLHSTGGNESNIPVNYVNDDNHEILTLRDKLIEAGYGSYYDISKHVSEQYAEQVQRLISQKFPSLNRKDLETLFKIMNFHYTPIYTSLTRALESVELALNDNGDIVDLKKSREAEIHAIPIYMPNDPLKKVITHIQLMARKYAYPAPDMQNIDPSLKIEVSIIDKIISNEVVDDEQLCEICYITLPTVIMINCTEGHYCCKECLHRYLDTRIFEEGKMDFKCMMKCEGIYSLIQLEKGLPSDVLENYTKRVIDDSLGQAGLNDLVRCPDCQYAAEIMDDSPLFECLCCRKFMCKHCLKTISDEEFDKHLNAECTTGKELKKEVALRTSYEELMTKITVRVCPTCKLPYVKENGCNHIVCRCGASICYVCRQLIDASYGHFSGGGCQSHTSLEEDEKNLIIELKNKAKQDREKIGLMRSKIIGVP